MQRNTSEKESVYKLNILLLIYRKNGENCVWWSQNDTECFGYNLHLMLQDIFKYLPQSAII